MVTITDPLVRDVIQAALEDRIIGLEMVADTHETIGDQPACHKALREWARARAVLKLVMKG